MQDIIMKRCADDSSSVKNKRRKKGPPFQFYNCKMALKKEKSCCSMVMCNTCMNKWVTTGSRSNDERSREEKEFDARKVKAPLKKVAGGIWRETIAIKRLLPSFLTRMAALMQTVLPGRCQITNVISVKDGVKITERRTQSFISCA